MQYELTTTLVFTKGAASAKKVLAKLQALPSKKPGLTELVIKYDQNIRTASVEATGSSLAIDAIEKALRQIPCEELAQAAVLTATHENGEVTHIAFGRADKDCQFAEAMAHLNDMTQHAVDVDNDALMRALGSARRYLEEEAAWKQNTQDARA